MRESSNSGKREDLLCGRSCGLGVAEEKAETKSATVNFAYNLSDKIATSSPPKVHIPVIKYSGLMAIFRSISAFGSAVHSNFTVLLSAFP
mmetsp:Transcript_10167/g.14208  ORF Transcript_10167/g.14208 Transcript_10167/m.14208 type:complete len:90 (+) Transcript_10167:546-815(+)